MLQGAATANAKANFNTFDEYRIGLDMMASPIKHGLFWFQTHSIPFDCSKRVLSV